MSRLARAAAAAAAPLTRRFSHVRLVRSIAYRLGEAVGDGVLLGRTRGGSVMALSMRDRQHRHIYFYGEYEPEVTALFRRLVTPGCCVLDVGANAGYFSVLSCELGAGRVDAFEPNPNVRGLLERSAQLGRGNIEVVAAACGARAGEMQLYLASPGATGMSSLKRRTETAIDVEVVALDDYALAKDIRPALIKIDVEGWELEVLAGARSLLEGARPTVIAETTREEVIELMRSYGYVAHRIEEDGSLTVHRGRLGDTYENICFVVGERANAQEEAAVATESPGRL